MIQNIEDANYFYWPSIEGSDEKVIKTCEDRAGEMYIPLSDVVRERLEWELDAICKHDFSVIFYAMGEVARKAHEEGYVTLTRGASASSLVSYLLGITEINPLPPHYRCKRCKHSEFDVDDSYDIGADLPDKVCPVCGEKLIKDGFNLFAEMLLGLDGDKVPSIDLVVPYEYRERAEKHLKELFRKEYVIPEENTCPNAFFIAPAKLRGKSVEKSEASHRFLRFGLLYSAPVETLSHLQKETGVSVSEITSNDKEALAKVTSSSFLCDITAVSEIVNSIAPSNFLELIKALELWYGIGDWFVYCKDQVGDRKVDLRELITSKDDIFRFLIKKGMSKCDAYKYMMICARGKIGEERFCEEFESITKKYNIEETYVESVKKITWLGPRAHVVESALAQYRLAWYKAHYPKEFGETIRLEEENI